MAYDCRFKGTFSAYLSTQLLGRKMKTIFPFVNPSESSYQSPGRWTEGRIPVRLGGGQVGQNAVQTTIHLRVRFKIGTLLPSVSEWSNIIHIFVQEIREPVYYCSVENLKGRSPPKKFSLPNNLQFGQYWQAGVNKKPKQIKAVWHGFGQF